MSDNTKASDDPENDKRSMREFRHDLLSLLNQILGYSELLEEEAGDLDQQSLVEDIQRIQKIGRSMERLISDRLVAAFTSSSTTLESQSAGPQLPLKVNSETGGERLDVVADFSGTVLVVDDEENNRLMLSRQLERLGLSTEVACSGEDALGYLENEAFDLVLLDVMMPGLSGIEVLHVMKSNERLRHVPVLMVSALGEMDTVCHCIESGAEDFLPKPIQATLLRSRVGACLEKKRLLDRERSYIQKIESTQARLAAELKEAADYLHTVFPDPVLEPFPVKWKHAPCSELAGDAFGYHWIDEDHFAFYILDVSGHGVRAALLAASAINVIRSRLVAGIDWHDPGQVLQTLNNMFLMERQNHLFFTMWYGVYNKQTHCLKYSGAGHPGAIVITEDGELTELDSDGLIIGVMEDCEYETEEFLVPECSSIYLITDGCFEVIGEDRPLLEVEEMFDFLRERKNRGDVIEDWYQLVKDRHPKNQLDDDFTMLSASFRGGLTT